MWVTTKFEQALVILRPLARGPAARPNARFLLGLAAIGAAQLRGVSRDRRDALLDEAIVAPVLPDTNVGASSDQRIIYIDVGGQRLPFRRDQEELTTSGIGISAWIGGEYQYPLGDPGTGSGASSWRLRAGGNLSRKEYQESRFDQMTLSGHVGPRWLIGRTSEVSLLLSGLHHWTGSGVEEPSHHDIGLRIEGRHRLNRRTTVNARASRHERRYDKDTHRDGPNTDVSLGVGWVASPTLRIDASAGWGRASGRRPNTGAIPAAGCSSGPRRCSPGASLWAARARCAGPNTRATGPHSRCPGSPAATSPAPCACSRITGR